MTLLLMMPESRMESWVDQFRKLAPDLKIKKWPDVENPEKISFALTWNHPWGEPRKLPNLKCIASIGAGVDHILKDPDLPAGVPVTRVVDPDLTQGMREYILAAALNHCRRMRDYHFQQDKKIWREHTPLRATKTTVGVMGLGKLGGPVAESLRSIGFHVVGWRYHEKPVKEIRTYSGEKELDDFLAESRILVCLLPLTHQTRNILNKKTFSRLPGGAYLIHAGRGDHLVEEDLIPAIDAGRLSGACLDVFREEPLPPAHPFWTHPKITITPHIASDSDPEEVARQILENYRRTQKGLPLLNVVDRGKGY